MFVNTCLVLSYIIRIFERPYYRQLDKGDTNYRQMDSFFDANYWLVVTMTTVGYGDLAPNTWMGRIVIMIASISGSFIMAIFIGSITNSFVLSESQTLALKHILIGRSAASTIQRSIKYFISKKNYYLKLQQNDSTSVDKSRFLTILLKS